MHLFWRAALLFPAMTLATANATASWQPGGNTIGRGIGFQVTASGPDRAIVAWIALMADSERIRAQAWTADGVRAAGWPAEGVLVANPHDFGDFTLAGDGAGGAFVAWGDPDDVDVRLQHISASGNPAPGWAAEGISLGAGYPGPLASDGQGGVLVARRLVYPDRRLAGLVVHRIDTQGQPAPGWPVPGPFFPRVWDAAFLVDPGHHVFVSTAEVDTTTYKPLGIVVRRLDESGVGDPSWPNKGVVLEEPRYVHGTWIFPDGLGGVYVEWEAPQYYQCDYYCPYDPGRSVARVLNDGSTQGAWSSAPKGTSSAPDGTGGVLVALQNHGRPGAIRLDSEGAVMPGWDPEGSRAMTEVVKSPGIMVTDDGRGGAFLAWWDLRGGDYHLYASRLDASGRLAEGWPETATVIGPRVQSRYLEGSLSVALASLSEEVAIAVWTEYPGPWGYITALRPGEPGPVADLAPIDRPVGFGVVEVRPNPAQNPIVAIVELPEAGPARLDLVDGAGRRLETHEFSFSQRARGSVRLDGEGKLPAGIYWLRLTQAGRTASRKVAVLH